MPKVTIKDVASLANVSISTVSRVINGGYPVSSDKREKVLRVIDELKFTPNTIATSLRNKTTKTIGMIIPRITNATYTEMISGVESVVKGVGYNLLVSSTDNDIQQEINILRTLRERMVDAVLVSSAATEPGIFSDYVKDSIPLILLDRRITGAQLDIVSSNDREASFQLVNYLVDMGHRRIAILKGVNELSITRDRLAGYMDAFNQNGLAPDPALQLNCDFTRDSAYAVVKPLLADTPRVQRPTAIYTTNTSMAEGVISAIHDLGLQIPEDISVVSFGNLTLPLFYRPQITCISRNARIMGETAGRLAIKRITQKLTQTPYEPESIIVYSSLKFGDSVQKRTTNCAE